jgi:RNA-directed DNA polymerase
VGAQYTRYADDLAFSGDACFARGAQRFIVLAAAIALEEGFSLNLRKTRVATSGRQQRVTGIVVNQHPNVPRTEFDRLKATLHNCVRDGPEAQNRAAHPDFRTHLAGRIAHVRVINPARAARLEQLFAQIDWARPA